MSNTAVTDVKIQGAMRLAKQLVAEMGKASDAAFLATMKGFVSHISTDPFLKLVTSDLIENRKVNFNDWYANAALIHKYEPPGTRPDEAAILFTLLIRIDRRQISVTDFMMEVDGLMRMDKCYSEFTAKYVERFIGYLEWVIQEKQYRVSQIAPAAGSGVAARGPDLFMIELQKPVFDGLMASLRRAVEEGLPDEDKTPALEELSLITRGFAGEATPTEVTAATERLCKKYDYFRTRLQDFASGASLLHTADELPAFVKALRAGVKE